MISVSPHTSKDKPHYTYVLEYPEDYPELDKAGTIFYVGKGVKDRINGHEREARRGVRSYKCSVIRKIWRNGYEIEKEILTYFATHKEACMYEIALIFFLPNLTNVTMGGDGVFDPTGEMYRRIGEKLKGRKFSEERRQKLKGRKHSEEHKHKISEANKGRVHTPEAIRKMVESQRVSPRVAEARRRASERMKGKKMPESARLKMIATKTGKPGKPHTEEARRKMSERLKGRFLGRKISEGQRQKLSERSRGTANIEHLRRLAAARKGVNPFSDETRRKMSERQKGKTLSAEARHKISEANKGRFSPRNPLSEEHRRKLVEASTGRKQSPETIAKRVAKNTGQKRTEETRRKMSASNSKKIWPGFIAPDGTRYENIVNLRAFSKEHRLTPSAMGMVGQGKWPQHKGWKALPAKDDHTHLTADYIQDRLFP